MKVGLSIKLNTILSVAGVLLVLLAVWRWVDAEERAAAVSQALTIGAIADHLLVAAGDLAVERGSSNAVIANPAAATPAQRATIQERRTRATQEIQTALTLLPPAWRARADLSGVIDELKQIETQVNGLRQRVDAAQDKDPDLIGQWFRTITRLVVATEKLRLTTASLVAPKTPQELVGDLELKHAFYVMSEYAGRERGGISGIIAAARPFTPAEYRLQGENRGAILTAWAMVQAAVAHNADLLAGPVERIRQTFFVQFEPTRQAVFQASDARAPYPLSPPDWFAQASVGIDAMLAAQKAIADDFNRRSITIIEELAQQRLIAQAVCLLALIIGMVAIIVVRHHVARPILGLAQAMTRMTHEDLNAPIHHHERGDEIGEMARALTVFRDGMAEAESLRRERSVADQQAEAQKQTALAAMARTVEDSAARAAAAVSGKSSVVNDLTRAMSLRAHQVEDNAQAVSQSVDQALASAEIVSAATEELTASIRGVAGNVQRASDRNKAAVTIGERAQQQIGELRDSVAEISKIAEMIAGVAQQTNLLALNATIEAARAGEAGRGFAVVASEVKSLANQTERSTETIKHEIQTIMARAFASVGAMSDVREAICDLDALWGEVAEALRQQQTATNEIARAVTDSTAVTRAMSERMASVISDAADVGDQAQAVESAVGYVVAEVDQLRGAIVDAVQNATAAAA